VVIRLVLVAVVVLVVLTVDGRLHKRSTELRYNPTE
jgi:hypothetical protein